jgi:tRNA nucleotidyltransferase (CCA-adding enzyme)
MMGREFAEHVHQYLIDHNMETHHVGVIQVRKVHAVGKDAKRIDKLGALQTNPEQSKHLETATTKVLGVSLDFVNLRSEKYTEDSRIPEIGIGTPYEDAHRRDLTINALFYNINTCLVEDWTHRVALHGEEAHPTNAVARSHVLNFILLFSGSARFGKWNC